MGEPGLQDAVPITNSLYCFTVYTEDTGTTTPNEELPILKYMLSKKTSIFACPEYDVFGDVEVEVGPDLKTIMVTDVEGDFHFAKRKNSGALGQHRHVQTSVEGHRQWRQVQDCQLGRQSGCRCGVLAEPPYKEVGEPDGASKRHLFRELQVRQLWLLWQFGGVLTGCLHHVACEHRLLQRLAEAQLEGRCSEWQVRSHGRGPLRADLLGRARRPTG